MRAEVPASARGDLSQESRGGHHLQQNHPFPWVRVCYLPGLTQPAFLSPAACSCLFPCCVFVSLGTQLHPWAHSGLAITDVKLPVIAWLEAVSPHTLEQSPHLCSSLILPLSVRPHLSALLGIILVNEAWCCGEVPSLLSRPWHRVCQ